MLQEYRKNAIITAEKFDGSKDMFNRYPLMDIGTMPDEDTHSNEIVLETLEGYMRVKDGDYIATGIDKEHWVVDDSIFQRTYTKVPRVPNWFKRWINSTQLTKVALVHAITSLSTHQSSEAFPKEVKGLTADEKLDLIDNWAIYVEWVLNSKE